MTSTRYTPEVGRKFNAGGTPQPFPGNTVVCMAHPAQAAHELAVWVQRQIQQLPFANKFSLLPPDSLHMTVIELLCDQIREPTRWSSQLPLEATLAATDAFFIEALATVEAPASLQMSYTSLAQWPGIVITLRPADTATTTALQHYRDAVAEASGVRLPNHARYTFHITLSYLLVELESAEAEQLAVCLAAADTHLRERFGIFSTGQPTLSFFDDMWRFVPADQRHTLRSRS